MHRCFSLPFALGHHSPPKPSLSNGTLVRDGVDEDGRDKVVESKTNIHAFSVYMEIFLFLHPSNGFESSSSGCGRSF